MSQERILAAIMFTDIVGYTALMGKDEQKAMELLKFNRDTQKPLIEEYNGTWLKEMGDGTLVSFQSASEAVYCAIKIQERLKDNNDLNLRIGIHVGEIILEDGDVFGDGVNIASRLEGLAPTGGIWISESVNSNIKNKQGIETTFIREEQLKNVDEPVRVYEVKVAGTENAETLVDATSSVQQEKPAASPSKKAIFIALAVVAVFSLIYFIYPFNTKKEAVDQPITIAVLAFDDQSPDGDQEWLGDGIADEILNVLAKVEGLQVTGKTSSFSFKGKGNTITEIGEILGVRSVLEGSVSKVGNKLRITAQLIDVETDKHIWSDRYDREVSDIFTIIDEVAQNISTSLMSELSIEEVKNIKMAYQPKAEAYEYFIKGEHVHYNEFFSSGGSSELFERAKDMYIKALSIDPTYGEALAGLAHLYDNYFGFGFKKIILIQSRDSILNIAYRVDPNSSYVLKMKGYLSTNYDSAFHFLTKAYSNDPNHLPTKVGIVDKLYTIGLYNESIAFCKKILKTDPLNKFIRADLTLNLWATGQTIELREQIKELLEFDKNNFAANFWMFYVSLLVDQDIPEANRIYNHQLSITPNLNLSPEVLKAWLLASDGRNEEILKETSNINQRMLAGYVYAALDNKQALYLLDSLNNSAINKYIRPLSYLDLKNNLIFDKLKEEPQFQEWLEEAKIVHDERVRKYGHLFDE